MHPLWTRGTGTCTGNRLAICEGPIIVSTVHGDGYPTGIGNGPASERVARLIVEAPAMANALADLEPYLGAIICYASTMGEHESNRIAGDVSAILSRIKGETT